MSVLKLSDSNRYEWLDEVYADTGYSYVEREDGDFEVFYGGKSIGKVESRIAVDERIAAHKGTL